jgi:gas vesicle protein
MNTGPLEEDAMNDNEKNYWGVFAIGISAGIIAGFLLGLLVAPKSGKESINSIKDKFGDIDQRIKEVTADRKKVYTRTWQQPAPKPYVNDFK